MELDNTTSLKDHAFWQSRLAERFFPKGRAGQRVRLNIDIDDFPIGGGDVQSLLEAVHAEAATLRCGTVLELLDLQARDFRKAVAISRSLGDELPSDPPPVLPGLALLVLAVHHGGNERFHSNEYYDRLRDLMGYGSDAYIDSGPMRKADAAWAVLEEWSCRLQLGRRGMFEARALGGKRYIGVPLRQALLSPADEGALKQAFAQAGLEPDRNLGPTAALRIAGAASMRALARRVLQEYPETQASRELVDDVVDIYETWNGDGYSVNTTNVEKRPIRIRFNERFPVLEDLAAICVPPTELRFRALPDSHDVMLESAELRDGEAELIHQSGASLADDMHWFEPLSLRFDSDCGRHLECFRTRHKFRWFVKVGSSWLEQFEDELEADRTYAEIRRSSDLTETPGAGSGDFRSPSWKALDYPVGLHVRQFRYVRAVCGQNEQRISGRTRGGIKIERHGRIYYDFALPDLLWPCDGSALPTVAIRSFGDQGEVLDDRFLNPKNVIVHSDGFGDIEDQSTNQIEVELQPTIDELLKRDIRPALVEAFLSGFESSSKVRIYLERTTATVQLPEAPRRSRLGALDPMGQLRGPVGLDARPASIRFDSTQLGRPLRLNDAVTTNLPHDRLCRLLRSKAFLPWPKAREQIRQCGRDDSFNDRHNLVSQLFSMHQMGLLEVVESISGGLDRVQALPPRLAITVAQANLGMTLGKGLHSARRFLLTGAWLSHEVAALRKAVKQTGGLKFHQTPESENATLLPPNRCVLAMTNKAESTLQKIADSLDVQFENQTPDAVSSLSSIAAISEVENLLDWKAGIPGAGYEVFEFDPDRICRTSKQTQSHPFQLRECKRRDSGLWVYFIIDGNRNRHAVIHDRQLGRWLVRRLHTPEAHVPVGSGGSLLVPLELRLPRHLERVFALESGRAPETVWFSQSGLTFGSPFLDIGTAKRFHIPVPEPIKVRPYAIDERCSHAFLRYPGVYGTPLWPANSPMPVLECHPSKIVTLGLNGENQ